MNGSRAALIGYRGISSASTGDNRRCSPWWTLSSKHSGLRAGTATEARPQAIARAKDCYDRLVKAAGQSMSGDSRAAMQDLADHGDKLTRNGIPTPATEASRRPERRRSLVERIQASHALRPQQPKGRQPRAGGKGKGPRPYHQRCAIRVTYLKNKTRGQWKAHGRYLARESATLKSDARGRGIRPGE